MKGEWRIWELGQLGFRALSDLGANVTMCQSQSSSNSSSSCSLEAPTALRKARTKGGELKILNPEHEAVAARPREVLASTTSPGREEPRAKLGPERRLRLQRLLLW